MQGNRIAADVEDMSVEEFLKAECEAQMIQLVRYGEEEIDKFKSDARATRAVLASMCPV